MNKLLTPSARTWLALVIGNSRLHWAVFVDDALVQTWDEPHQTDFAAPNLPVFQTLEDLAQSGDRSLPLWIASVVPAQTAVWANYPGARFFTLADVPLKGLYPTIGIDRALALWGAIAHYGSPVLVIDAGTALTFTGADGNPQLIGGAILPGLRLQFQALHRGTAALPSVQFPDPLPPRWARDTESAIASGILYTAIAGIESFIHDWQQQFPESAIVLTGGDANHLQQCLCQTSNVPRNLLQCDPNLIFKGIQAIKIKQDQKPC